MRNYKNEFYLAEILLQRIEPEKAAAENEIITKICEKLQAEYFTVFMGQVLVCYGLEVLEGENILDIASRIREDLGDLIPDRTNIRVYRELIETCETGTDTRYDEWAQESRDTVPPRKYHYEKWYKPDKS